MTEDTGGVSTIEHGGMTITSVGQSTADVKASLSQDGKETPEPEKKAKTTDSEAARQLGKRGGKASAEKRAASGGAGPAEEREERTPSAAQRSSAPAKEGDEGEAEGDEEPLTKRAQRRVEVATRKQAEARRELEAERSARAQERHRYEAELAAHRVQQGGPGATSARPDATDAPGRGTPLGASGKPNPANFESYEEYLDARDAHNKQEWERERQGREHATREVETVKDHVNTFLRHVPETLRDEIDPELLDMKPIHFMGEGEQITADNLIATEALYAREHGGAVLKYLSENPGEIQRLRMMRSPSEVQIEMRAIVRYLSRTLGSKPDATAGASPGNGDRPSKVETSKAHPPVRPVAGAPIVADGDAAPREGEDFDTWHARTQKRTAARR